MTPEEKAKDLIDKFGAGAGSYMNNLVFGIAKRSAIVCCDEILENYANEFTADEIYWQQVKTHLQSL